MKTLFPHSKFLIIILIGFSLVLISCQQKQEELMDLSESTIIDPPQFMNIIIKNYKPQEGQVLQHIFVSNLSVKAKHNHLHWMTARDGLSDTTKLNTYDEYGFSIDNSESTLAGFSDFMLYTSGLSLTQQSLMTCPQSQMTNSSNDAILYEDERYPGSPERFIGLRDCEKSYIGLNPDVFDYNNNGIPDYLELRCGLNPLNPTQAFVSTAGDGILNIDKCKMNIPIDESIHTPANQLFAYQYNQQVHPDDSIEFRVDNIPILYDGQDNLIVFYIIENNTSTNEKQLYSAYAILSSGFDKKTLTFEYWATETSKFYNQKILY